MIVGAGFAGCAVALYLERYIDFVDVVMLEELMEDQQGNDYGDIRLTQTAAHLVANTLKVKGASLINDDSNIENADYSISRSELLSSMRQALKKTKILFGSKFLDIEDHKEQRLSVKYCQTDKNGQDKCILDADLLVAADGLVSHCKAAARKSVNCKNRVLTVGDARRFYRFELDFSYRRIQKGASEAIQEGCKLGKLIQEKQTLKQFTVARNEYEFFTHRVIPLIALLIAIYLR